MNPLNHVAIIMDGNGRWGLKKKKNRNFGHKKGLQVVEKILGHCIIKKIRYLTLFTFSTENWKRPRHEIEYIFSLLENFLKLKGPEINNQNIRIKFFGERKKLRKSLLSTIINSEKLTKLNTKIQVNIAFNYGSKNEIVNAAKILKKKKLNYSIKNLDNHLYTNDIPNPEILIRTGNTKRLSNFMLWQIAYTEIFFEKKLWPDFNINDFNRVIKNYYKINRKFGNIDV
jgi:undecaprenyl diphosphate synthase